METIKEINKEIIVGLSVEKDGHVVIQTKAEELPTDVVQQIMDEVIGRIIHLNSNKNLLEEIIETRKELKVWRLIAFLATAMMFLVLLKMKGVL